MDIRRAKQTVYLALGVIVLGVIGFILYQYLAPTAPRAPTQEERVRGRLPLFPFLPGAEQPPAAEVPPGEVIGPEERKLIQLTDFAVISPSLDPKEERIRFYKKDGGDLIASSFTGDIQEKISNLTIVGLIEAFWSPARDRAAVFYLDGEVLKAFLHIGTATVAVLPRNITSFSWSPDGKSLSYLIPSGDLLALVIADQTGRNARTVFRTPIRDAEISWVSADRIAFLTAPSGLAEGFLFVFSRSSGAFTRIAGPFFGLATLWAPDGTRVLIATTNAAGRNLSLSLTDAAGKELFRPGLRTFAEKCLWASAKELFCAVPREIPPEVVLPDEYLRGELNTQDRIISLNTETRETRELLNEGGFDIANLLLTRDRSYLFFVNRIDGTLWSLKLK